VLTADLMEKTIRAYFDACNTGNAEQVMAFFTEEGTHYFPEGSPFGTLTGATCVQELGSFWTVDNFVGDPQSGKAVIEWTHFKKKSGLILRGDEWYQFTPEGKISEIRAYYASPTHAGVKEHRIGGFDYQGRGYPLV